MNPSAYRILLARVAATLVVLMVGVMAPVSAWGQNAMTYDPAAAPLQPSSPSSSTTTQPSVDPTTGAFATSFAIVAPAARGNVHPGVSLVYGSDNGIGEAGYGWSLNIPSIERRNPSGTPGAPTWTAADSYAFGGMQLVEICPTTNCPALLPATSTQAAEKLPPLVMSAGWTYFRAAVEGGFARFFLAPKGAYWHVELPSGELLDFGSSPQIATPQTGTNGGIDIDGNGHAFRWHLAARYDDDGNLAEYDSMAVTHNVSSLPAAQSTLFVVTDIFDTNFGAAYGHRVHFDYEAPAIPAPSFAPVWRAVMNDWQILAISVSSASSTSWTRNLVRRYVLTYEQGNAAHLGFVSALTQISTEGCDGESVAETQLGNNFGSGASMCQPGPTGTPAVSPLATTFTWQGDGQDASAEPYANQNILDISTIASYFPILPTALQNPIYADLDSDGIADVVVPGAQPDFLQNVFFNHGDGTFSLGQIQVPQMPCASVGDTNNGVSCVTQSGSNGLTMPSLDAGSFMNNTQYAVGNWLNNGRINVMQYGDGQLWDEYHEGPESTVGEPPNSGNGTPIGITCTLLYPSVDAGYELDGGTINGSWVATPMYGTQCAQADFYWQAPEKKPSCVGNACIGGEQPPYGTVTPFIGYGDGTAPYPPTTSAVALGDLNADGVTDSFWGLSLPWAINPDGGASNVYFFPTTQNAAYLSESVFAVDGGLPFGSPNNLPVMNAAGTVPPNDNFYAPNLYPQNLMNTVADMNGDGCQDAVIGASFDANGSGGYSEITSYELVIYPGTCDGNFDIAKRYILRYQFSPSTWYQAAEPWSRFVIGDVNGDGFADLVSLMSPTSSPLPEVMVLFGMPSGTAGQSCFGEGQVCNASGIGKIYPVFPPGGTTPAHWSLSSLAPEGCALNLADMDGSGVADVVVSCFEPQVGQNGDTDLAMGIFAYLTFDQRLPVRAITGISNGAGLTTRVTYTSSSAMGEVSRAAGAPWNSVTSQPVYAVGAISSTNGIGEPGTDPGAESHTTVYSYANPVYDGQRQQFLGFRDVLSQVTESSLAGWGVKVHTHYMIAKCGDGIWSNIPCTNGPDDPFAAMRGLPTLVETFGDPGGYLSTKHTEYQITTLYTGQDGRSVRWAAPSETDTYLYDTSLNYSGPPQATAPYPDVSFHNPIPASLASVSTRSLTNVQLSSAAHLSQTFSYDSYGHMSSMSDEGNVASDQPIDDAWIWTTHGNESWTWRLADSQINTNGAGGGAPRHTSYAFDSLGHVTNVYGYLNAPYALARSGGAPMPSSASVPGSAGMAGAISLGTYTYGGEFGALTQVNGPAGSCETFSYDMLVELVASHSVYPQGGTTGACKGTAITTAVVYDEGTQLPTMITDANGQVTTIKYDNFGRTWQVFKPDSSAGASAGSTIPSVTISRTDVAGGPLQPVLVQTNVSSTSTLTDWSYTDGYGHTVLTMHAADTTAGDSAGYIASGVKLFNPSNGLVAQSFLPQWNSASGVTMTVPSQVISGVLQTFNPAANSSTPFELVQYDDFNRVVSRYEPDTPNSDLVEAYVYKATSVMVSDETAINYHTPLTVQFDGFGRVTSTTRTGYTPQGGTATAMGAAVSQTQTINYAYLGTGEVASISQTGGSSTISRTMQYDSLGRMTLNSEPNVGHWAYAYDDAGHLVGTADNRGCGENFWYDFAGRLTAEDYSPCTSGQPTYTPYTPGTPSAPQLPAGANAGTTNGAEIYYVYDTPESFGALGTFSNGFGPYQSTVASSPATGLIGRLAATYSAGAHTQYSYDARGRVTNVAKQIAAPTTDGAPESDVLYANTWYQTNLAYNAADQPVSQSTGSSSTAALTQDTVSLAYSQRGVLTSATGATSGALVTGMQYDPSGFKTLETYGDVAGTTAKNLPDLRERLISRTVSRGPTAGCGWTGATCNAYGYSPPTDPTISMQTVLEATGINYVGGLTATITDGRKAAEWQAGAMPVALRTMSYDSFGRIVGVASQYAAKTGANAPDTFVSPLNYEETVGDLAVVPYALPTTTERVNFQAWEYDGFGNTTATHDDANDFMDRSLGTITNDNPGGTAGPNQLMTATLSSTQALSTNYDKAGNLQQVVVDVPYAAAGFEMATQSQLYVYTWNEVGQLSRAQRWDSQSSFGPAPVALPTGAPDADVSYVYDVGGKRVLRQSGNPATGGSTDAEIFSTLRLDNTTWTGAPEDYAQTPSTESVYLGAGGRNFARMVYDPTMAGLEACTTVRVGKTFHEDCVTVPAHVLFEIGDALGSSTTVIDKGTSELVERTTYMPYGLVESDYRPSRWDNFREQYEFTGKETDLSMGLVYFGARYYSPRLGRWASPDPLTIHGVAGDLNPYAYVRGNVFGATDPTGLDGASGSDPNVATPDQALVTALNQLAFELANEGLGCLGKEDCAKNQAAVESARADVAAAQARVDATQAPQTSETASVPQKVVEAIGNGLAHLASDTACSVIGCGVAVGLDTEGGGQTHGPLTEKTGYGGQLVGIAVAMAPIGKLVSKAYGATIGPTVQKASSRALTRALEATGFKKGVDEAAHHIVAGLEELAEPARKVLEKFGIGINEAENGVFLPANKASQNLAEAAVHSTIHTNEYYLTVNRLLEGAASREDVVNILAGIRDALLGGGL